MNEMWKWYVGCFVVLNKPARKMNQIDCLANREC